MVSDVPQNHKNRRQYADQGVDVEVVDETEAREGLGGPEPQPDVCAEKTHHCDEKD